MKPLIGAAALFLGLTFAALFGTLAGYAIGALLVLAPIVMALSTIRPRPPRRGPTPR